jgi:hypothetical protein
MEIFGSLGVVRRQCSQRVTGSHREPGRLCRWRARHEGPDGRWWCGMHMPPVYLWETPAGRKALQLGSERVDYCEAAERIVTPPCAFGVNVVKSS